MMRRKLGILILAGVTVLAGTQEAMRQFEGLRSSLNDWTRESLWSGLIVYAQPVSEGKLPAPQIYYLMPPPQTSPASPQQPVLADNNNNADAAKPETRNNHVAEELAAAGASTDALPPTVQLSLEVEDAAKSELVLNEVAPPPAPAPRPHAAPKLDKVRVYEEVARHEAGARKFRAQADAVARVFVKEFDAAKLEAELAKLAAVQEQLEHAKLKSFADGEHSGQRLDLKVLRRVPRPEHRERPELPERIKVVAPHVHRRPIAMPDISSIGCEKMKNASQPADAVESTAVAAGVAASVRIASEPLVAAGVELPFAAPLPSSTSWALGCDTEPEFSK
ncbi:MAG TPA: hypothetical protein VF634_12665 [Pyrinomonadaceae bacterium]